MSFKSVSRKFRDKLSGVSKMFQALLRVFQGCSVFESLLLYVTHYSYPSRRRARFQLKCQNITYMLLLHTIKSVWYLFHTDMLVSQRFDSITRTWYFGIIWKNKFFNETLLRKKVLKRASIFCTYFFLCQKMKFYKSGINVLYLCDTILSVWQYHTNAIYP